MFENKVLRKLCRPKRVEGTGEWRRLRSEELSDLYSLPHYSGDQIEKNGIGGPFLQCVGGETRRKETTWKT
jgi:hypothetical protein